MEYCEKGDLFQKISHFKKNDMTFDEKDIWNIFVQILLGLKALHDRKIFHRDLKSANIFLCKNGAVKIGDMNVSKVAKKGLLYTQTGTPYYASPEVWKDKPYDHKSDIWSLGCIVYEMCTLKPPFRAENMEGLYKKVIKGIYDKLPARYSGDLGECIRMMLHLQPNQRGDCTKLLSLPQVREKLEERFRVEPEVEETSEFLTTIKIPENLIYLSQNLPRPNYEPIRLRKTAPMAASSIEGEITKPLKNIFLSLNVMGEVKDRSKEQQLKPKPAVMHLPALKNRSINKMKGSGCENVPPSMSVHNKLKSVDQKKRVEALVGKPAPSSSLDYMNSRLEKGGNLSNPHRGRKNVKLEPIK
jgi:serine/threonine protein kinase